MSEVIITTSTLETHKDYDIKISQRKRYEDKPKFSMVGDGRMSKVFGIPKSIDLLEAVAEMSSAEKFCFFLIKRGIRLDRWDSKFIYQVPIRTSELSATDKTQFAKGFKLLSTKQLVRRLTRGIYMINPCALIPSDFEHEFAIWNNTHLEPLIEEASNDS